MDDFIVFGRPDVGWRGKEYRVTAGVSQGSILGPVLWKLAYDGTLEIDLPEEVEMVTYVDDLARIAPTRSERYPRRSSIRPRLGDRLGDFP